MHVASKNALRSYSVEPTSWLSRYLSALRETVWMRLGSIPSVLRRAFLLLLVRLRQRRRSGYVDLRR